ncbi:hypothetical protein AB0876_33495 [Mycobacterium sp. NPDC049093]
MTLPFQETEPAPAACSPTTLPLDTDNNGPNNADDDDDDDDEKALPPRQISITPPRAGWGDT